MAQMTPQEAEMLMGSNNNYSVSGDSNANNNNTGLMLALMAAQQQGPQGTQSVPGGQGGFAVPNTGASTAGNGLSQALMMMALKNKLNNNQVNQMANQDNAQAELNPAPDSPDLLNGTGADAGDGYTENNPVASVSAIPATTDDLDIENEGEDADMDDLLD